MNTNKVLNALSERLGLNQDMVYCWLRSGLLRIEEFRGLVYVRFLSDLPGLAKGTVILIGDPIKDEPRLIPAQPKIVKPLSIYTSIVSLLRDNPSITMIAEEYLVGYGVRVVNYNNSIYAILSNGLICPYTTNRIRSLYGTSLTGFFKDYDPWRYVLVGSIIGLDNPYHKRFYQHHPSFALIFTDVVIDGRPADIATRDEILESYGFERAPVLGLIDNASLDRLTRLLLEVEERGLGGIVFKDVNYSVRPMAYISARGIVEEIASIASGGLPPFIDSTIHDFASSISSYIELRGNIEDIMEYISIMFKRYGSKPHAVERRELVTLVFDNSEEVEEVVNFLSRFFDVELEKVSEREDKGALRVLF
ncbi:MAG: hypothetical protein ABWW69_04890, partial [Pyrodictiaceae archaeon]